MMLIVKDVQKLIQDANSGDVSAQIYLGYHYLYGFNVPRNLHKSYEIFNRLAEEKYTYGKMALENCFSAPGELSPDFKEIYSELREIISVLDGDELHESRKTIQSIRLMNHPRYIRLLAQCYLDGIGVPKDEDQGFLLYQYLFEKLDSIEITYVVCLLRGIGTEVDEAKAFACLKRMMEMDPNYAQVHYYMAMCHLYGWGTVKDGSLALPFFERAAKLGEKMAYYDLGVMYRFGEDVAVDMKKAIAYYEKGLRANIGRCATNLGVIYREGINGVAKDVVHAKQIFKQGVELGDADSMFNLACIYFKGDLSDGVPDYITAVRYFKMAAELGEPDSQYHLSMCYLNGWGVEKDSALATDLVASAAKKGLPAAQELLRENNVKWEDDEEGT